MEELERAAREARPEPGKVYPRGPVAARMKERAARRAENKQLLTVRFDRDVVDTFRELAGDGSYQRLMNQALREWLSRSELEATLRRVLREELTGANDAEPEAPSREESGAA